MSKELCKKDIVKRTADKLNDEKIVIGGNKEFYKSKYHLKYTQKIISNVIDAFWEVVAEAIEEGNTVKILNYIKMEPKYYGERLRDANGFRGMGQYIIPPRYAVKYTTGKRFKEICRKLLEREHKQHED